MNNNTDNNTPHNTTVQKLTAYADTAGSSIISAAITPYENPADKPRRVYLCDDSPEGILSAIYDAWTGRYGHSHNYIQLYSSVDINMFYEYIETSPDLAKAQNIASAIRQKISGGFYSLVEDCLMSNEKTRADDIYRLIILGFAVGPSAVSYLAFPSIRRIMKIQKNVWNEYHHYLGFIRFEELRDGTLFARFRPHNNIISKVISHFADRFPEENVMITDVSRHIVAISKSCIIRYAITDIDFENIALPVSANEELLKKLWHNFIASIEIKERHNPDLQKQNMPLRFREFAPL